MSEQDTYPSKTLLHVTVAEELLRRITDGTYVGTLPSQAELAKQLGVSRVTTRQAIGKLAGKGILESKQGAATFIKQVPVEETGVDPETVIIESLYELPGLASYLGFQTRDTTARYEESPNGTNFIAMMQAQIRMNTFTTLAEPVLRRATDEPNNPLIAGSEHLLVPMIRGAFSDELTKIEGLRFSYGGDIPGVTTSFMDIAAWQNIMHQDALEDSRAF